MSLWDTPLSLLTEKELADRARYAQQIREICNKAAAERERDNMTARIILTHGEAAIFNRLPITLNQKET